MIPSKEVREVLAVANVKVPIKTVRDWTDRQRIEAATWALDARLAMGAGKDVPKKPNFFPAWPRTQVKPKRKKK